MDELSPDLLNEDSKLHILQNIKRAGAKNVPLESLVTVDGVINNDMLRNVKILENTGYIRVSKLPYIGSNILKLGTQRVSLTPLGENFLLPRA